MDGKKLIILLAIITIGGLIGVWLWGESLINKYDLERAISTTLYSLKK